jgi:hypothetical protein
MRPVDLEATFEFSYLTLSRDDLAALLPTLIYLLREGRIREIKHIWFEDLNDHIRQPLLRGAIREELEILSECVSRKIKQELLRLCKTIQLATDSLIPFSADSKVLFQGRVALYKGISNWLTSPRFESNEAPTDVIHLEYVNKGFRVVALSALDNMRRAPDDAPLSGMG